MNSDLQSATVRDPIDVACEPAAARASGGASILLGGHLTSDERAAVAEGAKPRVDVIDLERRLEAPVYDFVWLSEQIAARPRLAPLLGLLRKIIGWSALLALFTLRTVRHDGLVYATGEDVGLPLAALLRLLLRPQPRLIIRMEQPVYGRTGLHRSLFRRYLRFAVKRADLVLCRTSAHARYLHAAAGVSRERAVFTPETTDVHFFSRSREATTVVEGIPTKPYILSAGMEMRDYETLIKAAADLPVEVLIAAGSPWSQLQFSSPIERPPANVRLASFQRFQMRELYRSATLVVVPVRQTDRACGMNVVLEAWAMKRPVIASRTRGLVDYIEDGQTGLFVDVENVQQLRATILHLLQHPQEAHRLAAGGYCHVTTHLSIDHYLDRVQSAAAASTARSVAGIAESSGRS